jgi:outer membrane protein OmpA-like peptidoglycan-associated protein
MKKTLMRVAAIGLLAAVSGGGARIASAMEYDTPGRLFGGVDAGVLVPLHYFKELNGDGGVLSPFIGYKLFQDKDLQLNFGPVGSLQVFGAPGETCQGCVFVNGHHTAPDAWGFTAEAGPRLSLPIGPVELYGDWQAGVLTGLSTGAVNNTSWGWMTGGGINYSLNENVALGGFGRYQHWYQRPLDTGEVRFVTAGLELMLQQSPPPPPPPPAPPVAQAAPPPPPPPATKKKIVLRGVNFDFNKYNIRPDAVPILEQACRTLKEEPSIMVSADGYTDSIGTDAYNQKLSERRANAVRQWLIKCGIPSSRISARGFGKSNPVASNATPEGRAQNRRTELVVTNQ